MDPFDYHLINISSALELSDAAIAKLRFPELGFHYAGIDNFEEEVGLLLSEILLNAENSISDNITHLLELRKHYLHILIQSLAMQPVSLKEDTAIASHIKHNLAGKVIVNGNPDTASTAVFYNNNIFSPLQKAVLNIKNAEILFYSGDEKITDSISINPKKSKLIFDQNLDVFALYKDYRLYRLLQSDSIYNEFSTYLLKDRQKKNSVIPALLTVNEEEPEKLWYAIEQNMQINQEKLYLFYSADIHRFEQYHKYIIRTAGYIKTAVYAESSNWLIIGTRVKHYRGNKRYELTDHRGNVMAVISDKKLPVDANEDGTIDYYAADIIKATDYAPFGMGLVDRSFNAESYRYGYNGKENDEETGLQDYGFRIYNPGLGRFLSVDPITKSYPELTPYQFASDNPLWFIDQDGLEGLVSTTSGVRSPVTGKYMIQGDANGDMIVDASERLAWNRGVSVWLMGGGAAAATVYNWGRAFPLLQKVFWWGVSNPHTAQGAALTIVLSISGYEGPDLPGPSDDLTRLGKMGYEKLIKKGITSKDDLGAIARNSYNAIINTIDDEIKGIKTLEEKALRAYGIRKKAMNFARELSGPELKKLAEERNQALYNNPDGPSFDELFIRYSTESKSRDDVYKRIIEASKRTDTEFNKKYNSE